MLKARCYTVQKTAPPHERTKTTDSSSSKILRQQKDKTMTVVIVGVDGSPTSMKAAESARDKAVALNARLHVVTAYDSGRAEFYGSEHDTWVAPDAHSAQQIARRAATELGTPGLSVTFSAARGKPSDALIEEAERQEAQLIVVGNVRMQGIGRVLGSVANSVAHNAPCDVLIVKTNDLRPRA